MIYEHADSLNCRCESLAWHKSVPSRTLCPEACGWVELGGAGAAVGGEKKKDRSSRFNPSTPNLTTDLPETQVNHNKCAYLSERVHESTAEGGDCDRSAAAYRVNKSAAVIVAFLFTVDKDFVWTPLSCCWNNNRGKCRRQATVMVSRAAMMGWIRHAH